MYNWGVGGGHRWKEKGFGGRVVQEWLLAKETGKENQDI